MRTRKEFIDRDGDSVDVTVMVDDFDGYTTILFGGGLFVYPSAAREAAQWVLDNVPAEDNATDTCGARR